MQSRIFFKHYVANLLLFLLLLANLVNAGNIEHTVELNDYLWFEFDELKNESNGIVVQLLNLRFNTTGIKDFPEVKVYYRMNQQPQIYLLNIKEKLPFRFVEIVAGKTIHFDVVAVVDVKDDSGVYLARTSFFLFGHSEKQIVRHIATDSVNPHLPIIALSKPDYWPQTGQLYTFILSEPALKLMSFDGNRWKPIAMEHEKEFNYIPPHDKKLDGSGATAFNNDIIYYETKYGTRSVKSTFSLLLHRSRFAHQNGKYGFAVFFFAMICFTGLIVLKRMKA